MKTIYRLALALALSFNFLLNAQVEPPAARPEQTEPAPKPVVQAAPAQKKPAPAGMNPGETAVVKLNNVNVRGRPAFIGEVITKLKQGEQVTVLGEITLAKPKKNEPSKWLRIAMPTNTPVWVHADFVDANSKTVKATKLQVRAGPGENYSTVGMLEKGDAVKEIRKVNDWLEIETPADTYAFVAADMIERTGTPAPAVFEPEPEIVAIPPDVSSETPAPSDPTAPATTEPAPEPPVVTVPPIEDEPLPKRIVTREGIIRRSLNVQTPSYFALESPDTGKTINYLYISEPTFTLKALVGARVIVTGEESIDRRWPNTPVIEIETLEQR